MIALDIFKTNVRGFCFVVGFVIREVSLCLVRSFACPVT